jgi:hypothetical protein
VVVEGEFSLACLFWAGTFWADWFWAGLFWAVVFWAEALLVHSMVVVLVVGVWGNNLGGCVAVEDKIVMKDASALL